MTLADDVIRHINLHPIYKTWSPIVKAAVYMLIDEGLRISDVLSILPKDVTAGGRVIVRQGKGSEPRVITPRRYGEIWEMYRETSLRLSTLTNYFQIYRALRVMGFARAKQFGNNSAVTSIGRKSVVQDVLRAGASIEIAAKAVGHVSTSSTEYYVERPKKRRRSGVLSPPQLVTSPIIVNKNGVIRLRKSKK